MLADTLKIQQYGDSGSSQDIFRPNATVHQDIWASDRTRCQDDLLANVDGRDRTAFDGGILNTGSSHVGIKEDLGDGSIR
jgi:hypothetical protein